MAFSNTSKLVFAKGAGLAAGCIAMPVAVLCIDKLTGDQARNLGHCIGRDVILRQADALMPHYEAYKIKSLPEAECAEWAKKSDEEKATELACELLHDGINLTTALGAGYAGTSAAKRFLGAKVPESKIVAGQLIDSGTTLGALIVLNLGLGHQMQRASRIVSYSLQKTGMTSDTADCAANSLASFSLPDAIGTGAGLAYLLHGRGR